MHSALSVCVSDHGHGFHWNILKPWDALKCPSPPSRLPSLVFPLEVFRLPGKWSANIETSTCNMNYPIIPRRLWGQGVAATHILKKFWSWWKENPHCIRFSSHFLWPAARIPKTIGGFLVRFRKVAVLNQWSTGFGKIPIQWSNGPFSFVQL